MELRKKELKNSYKNTPRPMGVFQVQNLKNGKVYVGKSLDLPAIFTRYRFTLKQNMHPVRELQNDWNRFGEEWFRFEVLEKIKPEEIPETGWKQAVESLEEKWLANLRPYGEKGYNKLPRSE
jgi:hypothetical protein